MNPISDEVKKVIGSFELVGDRPIADVAKELALPLPEIQRVLDSVLADGLATRVPFCDASCSGLSEYVIALSFPEKDAEEKIVSLLLRSEEISWLAAVNGKFDWVVGLLAPNINAVREFLRNLSLGLKGLVDRKAFSVRHTFYYFGHRVFSCGEQAKRQPLVLGGQSRALDLSSQEKLLFERLRICNSLSSDDPIFNDDENKLRFERLMRLGLVAGIILRPHYSCLRLQGAKLFLKTRGLGPKLNDELLEYAKQTTSVVSFAGLFGEYDFEFGICGDSVSSVQHESDAILEAFSEQIEASVFLVVHDYHRHTNGPF